MISFQSNNRNSSSKFSFLKLDTQFNLKKIEQKKKQQQDKNNLKTNSQKIPNLLMIQQCNKVMDKYKDHYNINRRFSIFYHQAKKQIQSKLQNQQQVSEQNHKQQLPILDLKRSQSTQVFPKTNPKTVTKNISYLEAIQIMRPLKLNQYINEKGIVKIQQKNSSRVNQIQNKRTLDNKKVTPQQVANSNLTSDLDLTATLQFKKSLPSQMSRKLLSKQNNQQSIQNSTNKLASSSLSAYKRKKYLKELFHKNINIILHKLKLMKLSLNDIFKHNIFDNSVPYKFGNQIFQAIKEGNEPKVFRILMQNRFSIFSVDTTGKTTLMWACIRGFQKIAELLLQNGVEPHSQDINAKSALALAIKYDNFLCVKTLFIYSYHVQEGIQKIQMSAQMRKIVRIGISIHKFLKDFDKIDKKKEHFQLQYKYYFRE